MSLEFQCAFFYCVNYRLNEEMIESLFVVNNSNSNPKETARRLVLPSPNQENRVLDPKKSQNIAILLKALSVTKEEVCEALLEGKLLSFHGFVLLIMNIFSIF